MQVLFLVHFRMLTPQLNWDKITPETVQEKIQKDIKSNAVTRGDDEEPIFKYITITMINSYNDINKTMIEFDDEDSAVYYIEKYLRLNVNKKALEFTATSKKYFRFFFDIEGAIENDLLMKFINDFIEFIRKIFNMDCTYAYTMNNESSHGSYSYHVFFNIYCTLIQMHYVIALFNAFTKYEYEPFIDVSVYYYGRLFRLPYAIRPLQTSKNATRTITENRMNDYHIIVHGTLKECMISNICGCNKLQESLVSFCDCGLFDSISKNMMSEGPTEIKDSEENKRAIISNIDDEHKERATNILAQIENISKDLTELLDELKINEEDLDIKL